MAESSDLRPLPYLSGLSENDNRKLQRLREDVAGVKAAGGGGGGARPATLVVAASDAPGKWKEQADVVCTGTNDHVPIQQAIEALSPTRDHVHGWYFFDAIDVLLSPGSFYFDPYVEGSPLATDQGDSCVLLPAAGTLRGSGSFVDPTWAYDWNTGVWDERLGTNIFFNWRSDVADPFSYFGNGAFSAWGGDNNGGHFQDFNVIVMYDNDPFAALSAYPASPFGVGGTFASVSRVKVTGAAYGFLSSGIGTYYLGCSAHMCDTGFEVSGAWGAAFVACDADGCNYGFYIAGDSTMSACRIDVPTRLLSIEPEAIGVWVSSSTLAMSACEVTGRSHSGENGIGLHWVGTSSIMACSGNHFYGLRVGANLIGSRAAVMSNIFYKVGTPIVNSGSQNTTTPNAITT